MPSQGATITFQGTEVSAAGGRYSEPEEGKVTSNQEGIYAVAGCDDNFSGDGGERCRWQIQRTGGRESYEQPRGHLCRRRVRR